jgi:hypothetical protein
MWTTALLVMALLQQKVTLEPAVCGDAEISEYGLACDADEPCPVYLELASFAEAGTRVVVAGNLHTGAATLWSVLLVSPDGGLTWSEPYARQRGVVLDLVQLLDADAAWVAGHVAGPIARDPFVLRSTDGGKSWLKAPLAGDESTSGSIELLRFGSRAAGVAIVRRPPHYQGWLTTDGGATWVLQEAAAQPPAPAKPTALRVRAEARAGVQTLERRQGAGWSAVAVFPIQMGACRPAPAAPVSLQ